MPVFGLLTGTELMDECVEGLAVHIFPDCLKVDIYNVRSIDRMESFYSVVLISVCKTRIVHKQSLPFFLRGSISCCLINCNGSSCTHI